MRTIGKFTAAAAVGLSLLTTGSLQRQEVVPLPTSNIPADETGEAGTNSSPPLARPSVRLTANSLLKPHAFFSLATVCRDYGTCTEGRQQLTQEQQQSYDEIVSLYASYGVKFRYSEQALIDQSRTSETTDVPIIIEAPEGKTRLLVKAVSLAQALFGDNAANYVDRFIYTNAETTYGSFSFVASNSTVSNEITLNTDRADTYARLRSLVLHELIHTTDVGYKVNDVADTVAIQRIKADITLRLTVPHRVWNEHYADRYYVMDYNPYQQIGLFVDENKRELAGMVTDDQEDILNALIIYANGLGTDGYFSEVDAIYVGFEAFRLKEENPHLSFPPELENILSVVLYNISTECFATIITEVLMGSGYYTDPEILALVQEYINMVRPTDQQIALDDLIDLLRYSYYEDTLPVPPYTIHTP